MNIYERENGAYLGWDGRHGRRGRLEGRLDAVMDELSTSWKRPFDGPV